MADNFEMRELFDDFAIAGKQDPDVGPAPERPGQRRRDGSKPADPNEVIHLRGNEQDSQEMPSLTPSMQDQFQLAVAVGLDRHCMDNRSLHSWPADWFNCFPARACSF